MSLLPAAIRITDRRGMRRPDGLEWTLRVNHSDLTSSHNYRWPFPGNWAEVIPGQREFTTNDPCPAFPGDGLCLARTWNGAASGQISAAEAILLVGWHPDDVLCDSPEKLRVRRAFVADVLTLRALLAERQADEPLNLQRADLYGADLRDVNLRCANLRCANLRCANLRRADLGGADLYGAYLGDAIGARTDA
jgi:hypothetical protein